MDYELTTTLTVKDFKPFRKDMELSRLPWMNIETEISIWWLLQFAIHKGNFKPFKLSRLQKYYEKRLGKKEDFWFNNLRNPEDIVIIGDKGNQVVYYTDFFINECYKLLSNK